MAPSPEPQPERIVLNDADIWPTIDGTPRQQQLCDWLAANGIDYRNVAVPDPLTVETLPDGQRVIRYTVYLRDEGGHRYVDPDDPNQAAREERPVPLLIEPPAEEHQHSYEVYDEPAYGFVWRCECGHLDPTKYSPEERGE